MARRRGEGKRKARGSCRPVRCLARALVAAAVDLAILTACSPAFAATANELRVRTFNIEAQPLVSALRAFATQSQVQIIYSEEEMRGLGSAGLSGQLGPREALERLLRGTDLQFDFVANDVAMVRKARATRGVTSERTRRATNVSPQVGPDAPVDDASVLDEVTITGSHIVRRELDPKSPIVTVNARAFDESGTLAIESVLNKLPQFVPSGTQYVTTDVFPTATNTPGIGTLNLRGLASNRTLVLIDGRRAQPANSTLVIDMNSIPSSAISRVEIITGGASATYGADAMGGVTNFRLYDDFRGVDLGMRSGITEAGDGTESRLSALIGAGLQEDRGNVMLAFEWTRRSSASIFGRPFFEDALTDPGAPGTAVRLNHSSYEPNATAGGLPSQTASNAVFPELAAGANVNRATAFFLNTDGTLFKDTGALGYTGELGQLYKLQPNGTLGRNSLNELVSSPLTRYAFLGRGKYAITDSTKLFAQATFASTEVRSVGQPSSATRGFAASIPRDADHPVPAELAALLDSRGANTLSTTEFDIRTGKPIVLTGIDANWRLGRSLDFLPERQLLNTNEVFQFVVGLQGRLPLKDWTWEAYISHGQSKTDNQYIGFASLARYRAIVEAPHYGRGFVQTGAGQTQIKCTSGLPIFTQFEISQDCVDSIASNLADRTRLTQEVMEANIQGGLMHLPAGEARAAFGAIHRSNEFNFLPDATRDSGSIFDIPVSTFSNAQVRGDTRVNEVYGELLVPLVRDRAFVDSLEVELGGRYSSYDAAGAVPTYKALFSWVPRRSVRFRGGFQLANRAPNINELFLSPSSVPVTLRGPDACRSDTLDANGNHPSNPNRARVQALCSAIIGNDTSTFDDDPNSFIGDGRTDGGEIEIRSGNVDVKSEKGRTWTFGVVLTSPFEHALLRNLSFTIDWYQARVAGAIDQVGAQTIYDLCFNRDGLSNPGYSIDDPNGMCRRIVRDEATGNRASVNSNYANLGKLDTSGIDVQASWDVPLAALGFRRVPGTLALDVSLNKLLEFKSQSFSTGEVQENEGTLARNGLYSYRALTTLRYTHAKADVGLTWYRLPSVRNTTYVTDPRTPFSGAKSYNLFDLAAGWRITQSMHLTLGIDNLFDRDPNRVGAGPGNNGAGTTVGSTYDVLGRNYYADIRFMF